jgi:hypothetical protein
VFLPPALSIAAASFQHLALKAAGDTAVVFCVLHSRRMGCTGGCGCGCAQGPLMLAGLQWALSAT